MGDFYIGKSDNEQTNSFLQNYKMTTSLARTYGPYNVVRHALKIMRGFNLCPIKLIWEEDIIANVFSEDVFKE